MSPYSLANGSCINCPIWPLNNMYWIDAQSNCLPCTLVTNNCLTCSQTGQCLSCSDLHYLSSNTCISCAQTFPFCSSCKNNIKCSICQKGYTLNSTNSTHCIQCSANINNCITCEMQSNFINQNYTLVCLRC